MAISEDLVVEIIRDIMVKHNLKKVEIMPGDSFDSEVVSFTIAEHHTEDTDQTYYSGNTLGESWNHWRSPVAADVNGDSF